MNADVFNFFISYNNSDILSSTLGPVTPSETGNLSFSWIKSMNQVKLTFLLFHLDSRPGKPFPS